MARTAFATLFARLRPPDAYPGDAASDAELLRRYAEARDPAAFELLVWRHGPLVLGTCRRVARDEADAEDAFQATFLVLARKAGTVRQSLPGWLHRTARRAALRAAGRRRVATLTADVPAKTRPALDADELALLDAAIDGLGERHRRVVVLCYLQGHSTDAAATILGVPRGTVLSRLATARGRLAATLTRRGLTLPTVVAGSALSFDRVSACVELTLNPRTAVPAAAIAQGVLTMMLRQQLAATAVALTLVGVGLTGTGVALMPKAGGDGPPVTVPVPPAATTVVKKDNPAVTKPDVEAVRINRLQSTLEKLNSEIDHIEDTVAIHERKNQPMSDALLKAKSALLIQVESQLFKTEVMVQESQIKLAETVRQSSELNRKGFTESEIAASVVRVAETDAGTLLRKHLDSVKSEIEQVRGSLVANVTSPRIEALEKESKALEVKYLKIVNARQSRGVELLFSEAEYRLKSEQKKHSAELASEVQSAKMYIEKRNALAREITDGEAPRTLSRGSEKLHRLKAARDIVESQLLHATYGDQKPSSTAADAKLDRVLSELIDLRAEVKRLRDGK